MICEKCGKEYNLNTENGSNAFFCGDCAERGSNNIKDAKPKPKTDEINVIKIAIYFR